MSQKNHKKVNGRLLHFQRTNNRIRITMNASKPIGLGAIFLPIFKAGEKVEH